MTDRFTTVLASASPRRRALLEAAGLGFEVRPTHVDESLEEGLDPGCAALELAERKANAGADAWGTEPALVIGSDTIVAVPVEGGWRMLGKPADEAEAAAFLRLLSGSSHRVVTGVCVLATPSRTSRADAEVTRVTMRPLTDDEVADYVASGEWRDKAGGYAIQESADRFVTDLAGGGFDNVVGLPVERTLKLLGEAAREEGWPWD
ncbi:MAG: Maf family protein [Planctomycetota bacterium]